MFNENSNLFIFDSISYNLLLPFSIFELAFETFSYNKHPNTVTNTKIRNRKTINIIFQSRLILDDFNIIEDVLD